MRYGVPVCQFTSAVNTSIEMAEGYETGRGRYALEDLRLDGGRKVGGVRSCRVKQDSGRGP